MAKIFIRDETRTEFLYILLFKNNFMLQIVNYISALEGMLVNEP